MIKSYLHRHPVKTQRALEILPGFVSWSLILFPFWGSFIVPTFVAYYVIAFAVYWLYKSVVLAILASMAYIKIQAASNFDWVLDLKKKFKKDWDSIHHLIVIPTYKEPLLTLDKTLESLSKQSYPLSKIHIMLSFEEREGQEADKKAQFLIKKYQNKFGHLWSTKHPDIAGEVKGKSSNTCWGAKLAKKYLVDKEKIPLEKITVTSEDADARFHSHYFAYLTYEFLDSKTPFNHVWQGGIVFYNNIWKVPSPVRVLSSIFSVQQMYILMRNDRLINFSSYSTTLRHVHDIGYWDTDVIPEDYRFFFKSFFAKKGNFTVKPIFLPVYADAAESTGFFNTMKNQYEQLKRWAWGVSDDAYIIKQYILNEDISFSKKTMRVFNVIQDHFLWPVNWFAVTVSATLPPLLNDNFNRTMIGKTLPQVTSFILTLSLISLIVVFIIDAKSRPPRPNKKVISYIFQPLEFILLPIIGFFFSALPGIDAHTRLMLGKYIEYKVTEKV